MDQKPQFEPVDLEQPPVVTQADMTEWYNLKMQLAKIQAAERLLRAKVVKGMFPNLKEGTTRKGIGDGYELVAEMSLDRKVDEPLFDALKQQFLERKIPIDLLVNYKPQVSVKSLKALPAEERKIFEQCLVIKEGSVSLKIEPTAAKKKQLAAEAAAAAKGPDFSSGQ